MSLYRLGIHQEADFKIYASEYVWEA